MLRVYFQNGPNAPGPIVLEEQFETEAEARKQLPALVSAYGTVPEATAWLEGDDPPEFAAAEPEPEPEIEEPEPESEQDEEPEAGGSLDDLTVAELDDLAEMRDVADYPKSANKDEKIDALRAAGL